MISDAQSTGPPAFRSPYRNVHTADQISTVRPFIGTALYAGVGASAIIRREDGRILMLQHVGESGWRAPAGFCDLGENVAQTAVREVWEETRLRIEPLSIIAVHATSKLNVIHPNGDQIKNIGVVFRARLLGGLLKLDSDEICAAAWMTPAEILLHTGEFRRWFYEQLLDHLDGGCFRLLNIDTISI